VNTGVRVIEARTMSEPLETSQLFHEVSEMLSISAGLEIFR
jgi:hypothetical protein